MNDTFDNSDFAFVLGFADELSQEDVHDDDPDSEQYKEPTPIPRGRIELKSGIGREFEDKVSEFIHDLRTGKKKFGDPL